MTARIVWLTYGICALGIAPVLFRLSYGRWPFVRSFPPRDRHALVNLLYSCVLAIYTLSLLVRSEPQALSVLAGLSVMALAGCLQAWAVVTMGPNWRMGQDPGDDTVHRVTGGPYRLLRNPIYWGLVGVALSQVLLAGVDAGTVLLVTASVVYAGVQGHNESQFWQHRPR